MINTVFHNYQQYGAPESVANYAASGQASPRLRSIHNFLVTDIGGQNLGFLPNGRPVRGGSSPSTHTWGALDWRWGPSDLMRPGTAYRWITREQAVALMNWLVDNSLELGVQAIHDYYGDRIWRAGRTQHTADAHTLWWKKNNGQSAHMGEEWARYFHVEIVPGVWFSTTPVTQLVASRPNLGLPAPQPPTQPAPDPAPPAPNPKGVVVQFNSRTLKAGMSGNDVRYFQSLLNKLAGQGLAVDGQYGAKTKGAVENWQRFFNTPPVDGILGPKTQQSIIEIALAQGVV